MARLFFLLGGARSGKSILAVRWAYALGREQVTFIATAQALDAEMRQRIAAHRAERPAAWQTLEAPRGVGQALRTQARHAVAVLDCLTLLVSNALLEGGPPAVQDEVRQLLEAWRAWGGTLLVVSNEVGLGIVPLQALARQYRDWLGWANQQVRAAATRAYWVVAGGVVPLRDPPARP